MKEKAIFNWSGGKDSALSLFKVLNGNDFDPVCLLTNINEKYNRISMHGVRTELLTAQATSIGLPLKMIRIPQNVNMGQYDRIMAQTLQEYKSDGISHSIFGDIFLQDLRIYREKKLEEKGFKGIFPLWNIPTGQLMEEFISLGFKAIVTCVNELSLDKDFVGKIIDRDFLDKLPAYVDPCGENGEFHSFVFDGPIFKNPVNFTIGEIVHRTYPALNKENSDYGFWFCDLLPPLFGKDSIKPNKEKGAKKNYRRKSKRS